jgi:hypothetical protein
MVAAAARAVTARVILVVMVPWASTAGVVSSPLVRSCGGVDATDEQELGMVESMEEEPCVEEPSGFRRGFTGSIGELKQVLHW